MLGGARISYSSCFGYGINYYVYTVGILICIKKQAISYFLLQPPSCSWLMTLLAGCAGECVGSKKPRDGDHGRSAAHDDCKQTCSWLYFTTGGMF